MKPEIKELWVQALLSGEYEQNHGMLRSESRFCCLGVLCDIYAKEHSVEWDFAPEMDYEIHEESQYLPYEVSRWSGLNNHNPFFEDSTLPKNILNITYLSSLNDNGYDFEYIAQVIQKHF